MIVSAEWTHLCGDLHPRTWEEGGCGWSNTPQREMTCRFPLLLEGRLLCHRCLTYAENVDGVWVTAKDQTPTAGPVHVVFPQSAREELDEKRANISATFEERP
jgi:hypothetical protein